MTNLNIRQGLSTELFIDGKLNPNIDLEEGCWYLCTDTAELFLGVLEADQLTLKQINSTNDGDVIDPAVLAALRAEIDSVKESLNSYATEQYVIDAIETHESIAKKEDVLEVKTKLEDEVIPTINETIIPTVQELTEKAATQEWVQEQGYLTEHQSLAEYAKKSDIPDTSDFITMQDVEDKNYLTEVPDGFATEEFVSKKIAEAELKDKEADLEAYYTKSEVDALIPDVSGLIKEIPAEYITESELEAKGYLTEHQSLEGYAKVSDLPSVEGLASESYVDEKVAAIKIPEVPVKVSELENDAKYATEDYVNKAVNGIQVPDVSNFITMEEVEAKGYINEVPSEYVTENELEAKGYLTEHQDLSHLAEKDHIHAEYAAKEHEHDQYLTEHQDLSEYAKLADLPEDKIFVVDFTAPNFAAALEAYNVGKLLLLTNAAPDTDSYAIMNYVRDDMITFTKFLMSRSCTYGSFNTYYLHNDNTWELAKEVKLNKVEANAEGEVNGELTSIRIGKEIYSLPNTDGLASVEYVDKAIAEAQFEGKEVDLTGYATEIYVNTKLAEVKVPTKVSELDNDAGYLVEHQDLSEYAKKEDLFGGSYNDLTDKPEIPSIEGLATEEFVNTAINNIELPEAELYKVDFNAPDYAEAIEAYNNGKVLVLVNAAPDVNSYAVMNYVSEKYITFTKFLTSRSEAYGSFNTYYLSPANTWEFSKEVRLNKVEANVSDEVNGELTSIRIGKEVYSLPNTAGLASKEYVDTAISAIPETDLTGLATEVFVQDEIAKIELPDVSNFITEEELDAKGFLTEQALGDYAKKSDIPSNYLTTIPDEYITESELAEELAKIEHPTVSLDGYATEAWVNEQGYIKSLEGYATEDYVGQQIEAIDLSGYAKAEDIPTDYLTESDLAGYSKFSGSYNDLADKPEIPSIAGLASESYVDEAIAAIKIPEVDLTDYSTTDEMNEAIATAVGVKADNIPFTTSKIVGTAIGGFKVGDDVNGWTFAEILAKLLELSDAETAKTPEEILEYLTDNNKSIYVYDSADTLVEEPCAGPVIWTPAEAAVKMDGVSTKYIIKDGDTVVEAGYQQATTYSDNYWLTVALPSEIHNIEVKLFDPDVPGWITQNWHMEPAAKQTIEGYTIWTVPEQFEIDAGATYRFVIID